jgi:hypothetical protein
LKHAFERYAKTPKNVIKHKQHLDKTLAIYVQNICKIQINTLATYVETLEQKFAIYVYNQCNICNIPIYFCNILMNIFATYL